MKEGRKIKGKRMSSNAGFVLDLSFWPRKTSEAVAGLLEDLRFGQ